MSKNDTTSIQMKLARLDELVAWFDGDEFELEKAVQQLQEAKKLATDIERDLEGIENEITLVKRSFASDAE